MVARGIHRAGPAPDGPFLAVNIASITGSLFESQLLRHVKGAFTGAERGHAGCFGQPNGGTLFLDEIGELPLNLLACNRFTVTAQTLKSLFNSSCDKQHDMID
ncbi:MAG: sigma 54-interacting transcriptional regulator [Syntrophobacteraceae bacterium]